MARPAYNGHLPDEEETDASGTDTAREAPNRYQQDTTAADNTQEQEKKEKKPGILKKAWDKLGLDAPTLMMMGKAALPPTIALSMFQADKVAATFSTLGYLVAIISILGL